MSAFVLDASAALSFCFRESETAYTRNVEEAIAQGADVYVPHIWPLEVTNVLLKLFRQKIDRQQFDEYIQQLTALGVQVDCDHVAECAFGNTLGLAIRHQLTSYDAAYLELAQRRGVALATTDSNLLQAARQTGTPVFAPGGLRPLQ